MKLSIGTSEHETPDTKFTQSEIDALVEEINDADRAGMTPILEKILEHQINPYHKRELDGFLEMLENEKFKLREIKSATKGVLMKITPTNHKGGASSSKFHYRSEQVHAFMANGHKKTRKNIVIVNGTKGFKRVEEYDSNKKRKTYKNSKKLSAKEISNIRRGKFMPGFFSSL